MLHYDNQDINISRSCWLKTNLRTIKINFYMLVLGIFIFSLDIICCLSSWSTTLMLYEFCYFANSGVFHVPTTLLELFVPFILILLQCNWWRNFWLFRFTFYFHAIYSALIIHFGGPLITLIHLLAVISPTPSRPQGQSQLCYSFLFFFNFFQLTKIIRNFSICGDHCAHTCSPGAYNF